MKAFLSALLVAALLGGVVSAAGAGGTRLIISGGSFHRFPHRPTRVIVVTRPVYVLYSPPARGYWTYQWIPQVYTSYVWVPGYYDAAGYWVDSQYIPQTVQTGYYQPLWVPGY